MKLNKTDIKKILPHRKPMLLVDSAETLTGESIKTSVYIDLSWDIFKGHFPSNPILPGVYIVEAMAQASALFMLTKTKKESAIPLFFNISKMRFLRPVLPSQTLKIISVLESKNDDIYEFNVKAFVDSKRVATGNIELVLKNK